jgi:hypothetical protein
MLDGHESNAANTRRGEAADHHEHAKDYLSPAEVARLLDRLPAAEFRPKPLGKPRRALARLAPPCVS